MINGEKIGVGVVTMNREHLLKKLYNSITSLELHNIIDEIILVNDGDKIDDSYLWTELITNPKNLGVGKSKNKALEALMVKNCDHIFLIEDDIFVKDPKVFEKYIEASKVSGIQHFNYSQHGLGNVTHDYNRDPNPRFIVDYKTCKIAFYPHCVGAFSYYSKKCLETVGFIDEKYYNACEHVDHSYEIIKAGMHPPYWAFADIDKSWEYLGDEPWSFQQSSIISSPTAVENIKRSDEIFKQKHGHLPTHTPIASDAEVFKSLKEIRKKYGNI
jgi:GT2 family glycosyltransferase